MTSPGIFESFNARALLPKQVSETFVPSAAFRSLCMRRHSLVLGPRGSGKTTLLKMLEPVALETWPHQEAEGFIDAIDFVGVFIPFDRSWQMQVTIANGLTEVGSTTGVLGKAAFSAHLYRCFTSCLVNRTSEPTNLRQFRRVRLRPFQEEKLAKALADIWHIPLRAASLLGVRLALSERLASIGQLASLLRSAPAEERDGILRDQPELFLPYFEGLTAALDAWEIITNSPTETWALAFDELELAPREIKGDLFAAMRSTDSRLLLKLALSPYDDDIRNQLGPGGPQAGQDYQEIPLWYSEKKDAEPFCRALWDAMLRDLGKTPIKPQIAFGRSRFDTDPSEWRGSQSRTAYGMGSRASRHFQRLADIDPSFRDYLTRRRLNTRELDLVPSEQRPAEIRKIAPIVETRLFFLRLSERDLAPTGRETARRSRKRLTLYTGWNTFCAVSEGNPRWFIGMVTGMLSNEAEPVRITQQSQAAAISAAARRYRAALRTIPVAHGIASTRQQGLLSVLDGIARYFRERQIEGPFSPEPPGSFVVDAKVSPEVAFAVSQSLNAGAIVHVPDSRSEPSPMDLAGRRYRLCYLLAAIYGLIPRLGRGIALSSIVDNQRFARHELLELDLTGTEH